MGPGRGPRECTERAPTVRRRVASRRYHSDIRWSGVRHRSDALERRTDGGRARTRPHSKRHVPEGSPEVIRPAGSRRQTQRFAQIPCRGLCTTLPRRVLAVRQGNVVGSDRDPIAVLTRSDHHRIRVDGVRRIGRSWDPSVPFRNPFDEARVQFGRERSTPLWSRSERRYWTRPGPPPMLKGGRSWDLLRGSIGEPSGGPAHISGGDV